MNYSQVKLWWMIAKMGENNVNHITTIKSITFPYKVGAGFDDVCKTSARVANVESALFCSSSMSILT